MKVACPTCSANLNIDDSKIPAGGARIKCPTCKNIFPVKPPAAAAVPLPGISITAAAAQRQDWEDEPTRAVPLSQAMAGANVPLPGAAAPAAPPSIPLPGGARAAPPSIPLPGAARGAPPAVPLPGVSITAAAPQKQDWEDEPTRAVALSSVEGSGAVPLPGAGAPPPSGGYDVDVGGGSYGEAPSDSIPLPGGSGALPFDAPAADEFAPPPAEEFAPPPAEDFAPPSDQGYGDASIPLPGGAAEAPQYEERTTVGPVPLPGDAGGYDAGSVPLPGPSGGYDAGGGFDPGSVPLPGGSGGYDAGGGFDPGSVPLPGGSGGEFDPSAVPLPGSEAPQEFGDASMDVDFSSSPSTSGVPLPGPAAASIPLPGGAAVTAQAPAYAPSVPLPGGSPAARGASIPLPGAAAASVPLPGAAESSVPLPGGDGGGFAIEDDGSGGGAAPGAFEFGEAPTGTQPSPVAASRAFEFGEAPASAQPPPVAGAFEFGEPAPAAPPPADDLAFDFNAPPPPPAAPEPLRPPPPPAAPAGPASTSYGEFDFGGPPPAATAAPSLEFDPTAPAPKADAADDLEADLSAPIPAPSGGASGPSDGLEMLSFIDNADKAAKSDTVLPSSRAAAGPQRRFHIKRRSGKTFGPFEEAVVVKMLEDGQLLGNEEVSLDGTDWKPIGSEASFQAVIATLMQAPSSAGTQLAHQVTEAEAPKGPSMERLKQVYEGRMAAVALVSSKPAVPIRQRLPLIIGAASVAVFLGVGIFMGVGTPYGFFAMKKLFPPTVKSGSREFEYLAQAKKGFLTDTFKSLKASRDSAQQALNVKEFPEARAVWCQAVFYLNRKYGIDVPADTSKAEAELPNIKLLGEKHPEVLKAWAGDALVRKEYDQALGFLGDALARQENANDLELLFLRSEALTGKKQLGPAKSDLDHLLKKDPNSARALHILGTMQRAQNEIDKAMETYAKAFEVDPNHAVSAVELADLTITVKHDRQKGEEILEKALADDKKAMLSPGELGKALALKAETIVLDQKPAEAVPVFRKALEADANSPFTKARLGNAYMLLFQPEKAYPLYRDAYAAAPDNLDYVEGYLKSLIFLGKMDDAVKVVQTANQRFPGNAALAYFSGRVNDALDKVKDAEDAYKRAIAAQPDNSEAYLYLARLHMRFRRYAEAKPVLEAGLEKDPNNAQLHVGLGELAYHERDLDKADAEFKRATELDANSSEGFLGLSKVSLDRQKPEEASSLVERSLSLNPRVLGGRLQRGMVLWKLKKLDEAIDELAKAREDEPRNLQLIIVTGAVKFEKGDYDGALGSLGSALQTESGNPDANYFLGRVKNKLGQHSGAIEAMKRAVDINGKNPDYRYWMGQIYMDAQRPTEAIEEWKATLDLAPKYVEALASMGSYHFDRAGKADLKKAVEYFQKALAIAPDQIVLIAKIGEAEMKMENWDAAIASFTHAVEADPDAKELKDVYLHLGQCFQEKNKIPKAIEWYKKAIEVDPKNADAYLSLGWLYKTSKKRPEAIDAFTKYIGVKPDAENIKEIQDEIYDLKKDKGGE